MGYVLPFVIQLMLYIRRSKFLPISANSKLKSCMHFRSFYHGTLHIPESITFQRVHKRGSNSYRKLHARGRISTSTVHCSHVTISNHTDRITQRMEDVHVMIYDEWILILYINRDIDIEPRLRVGLYST